MFRMVKYFRMRGVVMATLGEIREKLDRFRMQARRWQLRKKGKTNWA
jgi:hypothetical protein